MKTIFFHIGQTKTATTTLQTFFSKNREWLANNGILYPLVPDDYPIKIQHRFLMEDLPRNRWNFINKNRNGWDFLLSQFASSKFNRFLISEELFWHLSSANQEKRVDTIKRIRSFLSRYDVKIICYLRRQDSWIESWYNQIVKTDVSKISIMDIEDFVELHINRGIMDYYSVLSDWDKVFGKENMIVKAFEKSQWVNGNILEDFLSLLSINDLKGISLPEDKQVKLSNSACAFSVIFNKMEGAEKAKSEMTRLMRNMSKMNSDNRHILPKVTAERLLSLYAESNRNIAARYMSGRTELFDNYEVSYEYEEYPGLSAKELAEIVSYLFIEQQKNNARQKRPLNRRIKTGSPPIKELPQ